MIGQARGRLPRLNLTLRMSPPEAAGQEFDTSQEFDILADAHHARPHVIQVSTSGAGGCAIYRLWSDGVIELAHFTNMYPGCVLGTDGSAWSGIPEGPAPVPPGIRVIQIFTYCTGEVIRVLSDGTAQRNKDHGGIWCGWQDVPGP